MFRGIEWSSGRELGQTVRSAERAGIDLYTGKLLYDIDTPEDLLRLYRDRYVSMQAGYVAGIASGIYG